MKALTEWFKEKKKLIIVVALIALLILVVFLFFGTDENSVLNDTAKSETELRLTALLESMDGINDAEVMITENDGEIEGVVIVCDGADRILVRNNILNAVSTALNIDKNIIAIYSM